MFKNYYAIIPADVRYDNDLNPNAKLLYGEITALANTKGYCWASNEYFANLYDVRIETVSRWISMLNKKGFITVRVEKSEGNKRYISIGHDNKINSYCENSQEVLTKKSIGHDNKVNTPKSATQGDDKGKVSKKSSNNTINNTVNNTSNSSSGTTTQLTQSFIDLVIDKWNELGLQQLRSINTNTKRHTLLRTRLNEYSEEEILEAIANIHKSKFLKGQNNKGWTITFDWLVKPNNFLKVLEGNYTDKEYQGGVNNGNNGYSGSSKGNNGETEEEFSYEKMAGIISL